jgi:hypothetical protein
MNKTIFLLLFSMGIVGIMNHTYSQIEYTSLNPQVIQNCPNTVGTNYYSLDLNDDNIPDYKIGAKYFETNEGPHPPDDAYEVFIYGTNDNTLSIGPFNENDSINGSLNFYKSDAIIGYIPPYEYMGAWNESSDDISNFYYIGLRIKKKGQSYYGWLYIKASPRSFTIRSYAYNKTAGQAIITNEPN